MSYPILPFLNSQIFSVRQDSHDQGLKETLEKFQQEIRPQFSSTLSWDQHHDAVYQAYTEALDNAVSRQGLTGHKAHEEALRIFKTRTTFPKKRAIDLRRVSR